MDKKIIAKLQAAKEVYVIFSAATNCPYVFCDPDTADDEIFVYLKKQAGRKERDRLTNDQIPVSLATVRNGQFLYFYTSLYTMGVNAVMLDDGSGRVLIQLSDIVKRRMPDAEKDGKVWIENPGLHLTALYLMQELRKPQNSGTSPEQQEMMDEINADLRDARLIQPVVKDQKAVPMLKVKEETYQPMFTDILEFQKFNSDGQFNPVIVDTKEMKKIILPQATGILINPRGVNLPIKIGHAAKTAS